MRIGVDATCWQNRRGYGRHTRSLLTALVRLDEGNRYTFFFDSAEGAGAIPPEVEIRMVRASRPAAEAASAAGRRPLRDLWRMSRAISGAGVDLVLFPTIYTFVPVFGGARKIVFIHDVIPEQYPRLALGGPAARLAWKLKAALGRLQADAIVTVSEYSRDQLVQRSSIARERVFVVGEAADPVFRQIPNARPAGRLEALGVSGRQRIVVCLGGFGPHKNVPALVDVFSRLASEPSLEDAVLLLAGEHEREVFRTQVREIRDQVARLGLGARIRFTGYLPDEDLAVLLNVASVLVLPSLMEGFGLPAVEAAACGCPVIATEASPLEDLLGDGGIYINPNRPRELEDALRRVLVSDDLRRRMGDAALAAARKLTWNAAATQLRAVIRQVMAGRTGP